MSNGLAPEPASAPVSEPAAEPEPAAGPEPAAPVSTAVPVPPTVPARPSFAGSLEPPTVVAPLKPAPVPEPADLEIWFGPRAVPAAESGPGPVQAAPPS